MKQIVPFTRKIEFNTSVDEITSISLDKKVKEINNGIISGVFDLYLEYKENDISVNVLKYSSSISFDIDIDEKYDLKDVIVDIDDFYYEIDDNSIYLHIDVLIDNLTLAIEEINIIKENEKEIEEIIDEEKIKEDNINEINNRNMEESLDIDKIEDLFKEIDDTKKDVSIPIFETFNETKETFVTYNVHIVRDNDNIESICLKYGVTKEELSYYNDISMIKLGDKLIVPTYKK